MTQAIKLDINFLDKPLWLQVAQARKTSLAWQGIDGYTYTSAYKAPGDLDMLFLLYMLMKSQQQGYQAEMVFSRYQILKGCCCPVNNQYLERLLDSLKRWEQVQLDFHHSFLDEEGLHSRSFRIIRSFCLDPATRKLAVAFDSVFLKTLQASTLFKYLHLDYYLMLKRPISRRLFELFQKAFKESNHWSIPLSELGRKLALYTRRAQVNGDTVDVIFPSDVLTVLRPAIEEINALSERPLDLCSWGIDPHELLLVSFRLAGKEKDAIVFRKFPVVPVYSVLTATAQPESETYPHLEIRLQELLGSLKKNSRQLKQVVSDYYTARGFDYVKWNILYANRYSSGNYSQYLKLSLEHDWAFEFREEQELLMQKDRGSKHENIDLKAQIVKNIAKKAHYIFLARGRKYRIQKIFDNGVLEILREDSQMRFTVSPERAFNCRFESIPDKEIV